MILWNDICTAGEGFRLEPKTMEAIKPFFMTCNLELLRKNAEDLCRNYSEQDVVNAYQNLKEQRLFRLLCILAAYQDFKSSYQKQNFTEKMFRDVTGDLNVWLNTTQQDWGYPGLSERIVQWFFAILHGNVKQFGRLQCNTYHLFQPKLALYAQPHGDLIIRPWNDPRNPAHPSLAYQDKVVNLHIPASGKLYRLECIQSLREIVTFMKTYTPDYDYKAIVCYSWLLSPFFKDALKPDSNIRKFQTLGHVFPLPALDEAAEIKWRIWGERGRTLPLEKLPQDNSIRKAVAQHLMQGKTIPCGCMVILTHELEALFAETVEP